MSSNRSSSRKRAKRIERRRLALKSPARTARREAEFRQFRKKTGRAKITKNEASMQKGSLSGLPFLWNFSGKVRRFLRGDGNELCGANRVRSGGILKLCCATRSVSALLTAAFRVRNSKPHSPRRPPFVPFGGKSCRKAEFLEKRAWKSEKCFAKKQGFQRCSRFAQSIVFPAEPLDGKQSDFLEKGRNSIVLLPYPRLTRAHTVPTVCSEGVPCAP